jgi:uncharacterized protein (TIGR02147 family)
MENLSHKLFLEREFSRRCGNNPRYSLRAFARFLGVSHTVLSLVMNGKRNLSKKALEKISDKLSLSPIEASELFKTKFNIRPVESQFDQLSLDTFSLISDWEHYAILSLLEIPQARFNHFWMAKRLGITPLRTKMAMDRLLRLGLVKRFRNGKYKQVSKPIKIENKISTPATRKFQKQLLELALESIDNDPMEIRDMSSITFAMNPKDVPWALEQIRKFRRELCSQLEQKGRPKEVYNLCVQLYPVTKKISEEKL